MNREVGALISLQPNAQKIVNSWNIDEFLQQAKPMVDTTFRVMNTAGQIHLNMELDSAKKYGADRIVYHRQDLHKALKLAATSDRLPGPPAKIVTSSRVVDCDCESGTVSTADGSVYQGDLIIGADGIHSAIRQKILAPEHSKEPQPTGISAYRLLVDTKTIQNLDVPREVFDPKQPVTSLIMGYDRRVIMGPARGGEVLGLVCMVPDEHMEEASINNSWTSAGSLSKLLETYHDFPEWIQAIFKQAPDIALWQLRDIDPLATWVRGRAVIIGDAAHAMLPTQGQGASQSIEDAEGLQAFLDDVIGKPTAEQIESRLETFFRARYDRASLIQTYSRQQARPATEKGSTSVKLNPAEFMDFNCNYAGARKWLSSTKEVVV